MTVADISAIWLRYRKFCGYAQFALGSTSADRDIPGNASRRASMLFGSGPFSKMDQTLVLDSETEAAWKDLDKAVTFLEASPKGKAHLQGRGPTGAELREERRLVQEGKLPDLWKTPL